MAPRQKEYQSWGIDQSAAFVETDPFGGLSSLGVKVPTLSTAALPSANPPTLGYNSRYLFHLASFHVPESGGCARITGYRLNVQIWALQSGEGGNRYVKQTVYDPAFSFQDGNWSWHLRFIPDVGMNGIRVSPPLPVNQNDGTTANLDGTAYRWADTPAILYENMLVAAGDPFYVDLLDYTPPNSGRPWGEPLAGMGTFYGVSTPWNTHGAWSALDIECDAPGTYALFCSVRQTNPSTRTPLTPPGTFFGNGLSAEEQFLLNFPTAFIGSVGGSLVVTSDDGDCGDQFGNREKEGPCS
jgi:hypothetical protein